MWGTFRAFCEVTEESWFQAGGLALTKKPDSNIHLIQGTVLSLKSFQSGLLGGLWAEYNSFKSRLRYCSHLTMCKHWASQVWRQKSWSGWALNLQQSLAFLSLREFPTGHLCITQGKGQLPLFREADFWYSKFSKSFLNTSEGIPRGCSKCRV